MTHRIDLIIIDPQNDFCYPGAEVQFKNTLGSLDSSSEAAFTSAGLMEAGSLFVPGANEDMQKVAKMIDEIGDKFFNIHVTMDCHHYIDIAHPVAWTNSKGESPDPFTIIEAEDVENGKWYCTFPQYRAYTKMYVNKLKDN